MPTEHIGRKGRLGRGHSQGITSAQHPVPEAPKAMHDSHLPAIIRTASPNLHIEPRRRSNRDKDPGALSLSPATSRISPHPGTTNEATTSAPVAQWIEQAPSKRLAAGSSPAGGARRRPPSGGRSRRSEGGLRGPGNLTAAYRHGLDRLGPSPVVREPADDAPGPDRPEHGPAVARPRSAPGRRDDGVQPPREAGTTAVIDMLTRRRFFTRTA